jgi:ketosteroid isomerase-like protein
VSEEENLAVMREFYDRWGRGETEGWEEVFDPDVEWHTAREDPDADVHRGIPAVRAMFESWTEAVGPMRGIPKEMRASGDRVFVWQQTVGRGMASGVEVVWEGAYVWTLRDGRIVRVQIFFDRGEALEAAALSE